jgi:hypothetical protein
VRAIRRVRVPSAPWQMTCKSNDVQVDRRTATFHEGAPAMSLQATLSTDAFASVTYSPSLVALTNALLLDTPVCRTRLHTMPDDFAAQIGGKRPAVSRRREERVWWSGRRDLNPGPSEPHSDALPGCATPRGRAV